MAPSAPLRVWQGDFPRHKCVIWACGRLLELFSICITSLFVVLLILLVIGGIETNPGPPENDVQYWEFDGVTQMTKEYKTSRTVCGVCGKGNVTAVARNTEQQDLMLVYTQHGTMKAKHVESRCVKKNCRALHGCGFFKEDGHRVYEEDALKEDILVISSCTAMQIEYLIEISATIEITSANFEGLAKVYNWLHNQRLPTAVLQRREDLYKKRLTEAYYLFIYLELAQRYHIKNYQRSEGDEGSMILKHKSLMQTCFNERWAVKHRCEVEGCGWCITIDGGLKPHRMLCGAKLSGIRLFPNAGIKIFTGCTRHPGPKSKYCLEHESEESPVIHVEKVSAKTKEALRNTRTGSKNYDGAAQDDFFIVESLLSFREGEVEVKWVGFEKTTWEPEASIPGFLR